MRWEDERYVRVYTRDTTDWLALSFDAQALFLMLLRKVDRAGLLPLGKHGKRGVAIAVGHPGQWARLEPALEELLADGCVSVTADGVLLVPNFLAAQEARASDKARQQKARELARDTASVTPRDVTSQNVTESHTPSHAVTDGHAASHAVTPSCAVPSLAVPSRDLFPEAAVASPAPAKKAKKGGHNGSDPRHAPLVKALTDAGYPFHGGKDAKAVSTLLALADQREASRGEAAGVEVLRRARIAWAWVGFPACKSLTELASHWGHYEREQARGAGPPRATDGLMPAPASECAGCGAEGETASVGEPSVLLGYWCGCMAEWAGAGLHFTKAREWAERRKHGG